jgi:hypothetical protein
MKTKNILTGVVLLAGLACQAQSKPADTVVIKVGEASRITVTVQDKNDLETMKKYDFQKLMTDLIAKLEQKDTVQLQESSTDYLLTEPSNQESSIEEESVFDDEDDDEDWDIDDHKNWHGRRTYHSINFDVGMNNYLSDGTFPDADNSLYTVKPWGSWYVGINSNLRTRVSNKFFLEWGLGVSWYNFKYQNEQTQMSKDDNSVIFTLDTRDVDYIKSKLTATYINASLIPIYDFGGNRRKPSFFDSHGSDSFRFGAGPYVGYRIDSYSKQAFNESGDKKKVHDHDNFYLNNVRYGVRLQVGYQDVDFFFNYDLNELYIEDKGPKLNAFSFGITF